MHTSAHLGWKGVSLCRWGYVRHHTQRRCRLVTGEPLPWFMSAQWHRWTDKEYPRPSLPYYISSHSPSSERPSVLKRDAAPGVWRYFTGMNMLSANNTLSGWAETQYSALFTPPHHKLHSCESMKVCTQAQRDKKNTTLSVASQLQQKSQCELSTRRIFTFYKAHRWLWLKQNLLKSSTQTEMYYYILWKELFIVGYILLAESSLYKRPCEGQYVFLPPKSRYPN